MFPDFLVPRMSMAAQIAALALDPSLSDATSFCA